MLLNEYRGYQLDSLSQHLVILNLGPRLRGLLHESLQKLSEFLQKHKLLDFCNFLDSLLVDQFEFNPNQDSALVEAHISL